MQEEWMDTLSKAADKSRGAGAATTLFSLDAQDVIMDSKRSGFC